MGNASLRADRSRDVDHVTVADSLSDAGAISRKLVRSFAIQWGIVTLLAALIARLVFGTDESKHAILAFAICLPGALASTIVVGRSLHWPVKDRTVMIAAGNPLRLISSLILGVICWCVILSPRSIGFWGWFIVAYALTLAVDVRLILRVLRQANL